MAEKRLKLLPALLGIFVLVLFLYIMNMNFFANQQPAEGEYQEEMIPEHEIVDLEEAHLPEAKRYEYHVLVKEEVDVKPLRHTSYFLLEKAKEDLEFNGVAFSYYDREEYVGRARETLGQAFYAPYGNPGRVAEVSAGDYENMEFSWSLRSKDWEQQLSDREAEIWAAWQDLYQNLQEKLSAEEDVAEKYLLRDNDKPVINEEAVSEEIAANYEIELENVENIRSSFSSWTSMDKGN